MKKILALMCCTLLFVTLNTRKAEGAKVLPGEVSAEIYQNEIEGARLIFNFRGVVEVLVTKKLGVYALFIGKPSADIACFFLKNFNVRIT